jgi:uncharacterized iron-regulated membrane protein
MSTSVDVPDPVHEPEPPALERPARRPNGSGWFRAFWRWHFYAAFLVIPFLFLLAVTGLIYLLRFQVEPMLHPDLMRVAAPADQQAQRLPYASQLDRVENAHPDWTIASMTEPDAPDAPTRFSATTPDDTPRDVFVDPWTGTVLGDLNPDTTLSGAAIRLHGDLMAGPVGDAAIELAACWSIVMAVTGYLIFFRGRTARRRRSAARNRTARLRSGHGWTGAIAGAGLLAMVVTGLPWTGVWGAQVQNWAAGHGTSLWSDDPGALSDPTSTLDRSLPHSHAADVPWAMGKEEVPDSTGSGEQGVATVDTALAVGAGKGLRHPMTVALPERDGGSFSVIGYAFDDPTDEKTVHVDRFGGTAISTYGYDDYPAPARAVAQGIALHEGRSFGLVNFWGSLLFCLAVIALCVTGPMMWWRRRPTGGGLAAPRGRLPIRRTGWVAVLLVALGVFLPLFGASLVVVLVLDQVARRIPRLRRTFAVVD